LENEIKYPTPLGTFSVGVVIDPVEYFKKDKTLTVRLDCEDSFYDLHGQDFNIEFESGYYQKISLAKRGDDILLDVQRMGSNITDCPVPMETTSGSAGMNELLEKIIQRGYVLVSTDQNYEPQSFLNSQGVRPADSKCPGDALTAAEMQGFDVDVANAIGESLGVETCYATPDWEAITAGNWGDGWDVSVGSMSITIKRQRVLDFSVPYYFTPAVVAVADDSGITSLDGLSGFAVCAGTATTYEAWLNNDMANLGLPESSIYSRVPANVDVVSLTTDQECANAIATGRKDFVAFVTSSTVADANLAAGMPIVKLEGAVFSEDIAAAFDKASSYDTTSLRAEIDNLFNAMHMDGRLSKISKKWFGVDLTLSPR
jgi:polar amino acid transport system substrate-binding protein